MPIRRAGMRRSQGIQLKSFTMAGGLGWDFRLSTLLMTRFWMTICRLCVISVGHCRRACTCARTDTGTGPFASGAARILAAATAS